MTRLRMSSAVGQVQSPVWALNPTGGSQGFRGLVKILRAQPCSQTEQLQVYSPCFCRCCERATRVSPEARRGSQGASRAAPGKSGLHARGEGERVMALESREGLGPRDALKKDSRGLSRGAAGNPRFPGLLPGTLGNFTGCL